MDLIVIGLFLFLYFVPTMIAAMRSVNHGGAIMLINLLLGWTIIGWFAALIWAIVEKPEELKPISA